MKIHLKHSLRRIVVLAICLVTMGLMICSSYQIKAEEVDNKDIIIETKIKEVYTKEMQLEVKLVANNTKVINEYTYLSYHLYDKTGDVILYENERIPINLDKQGEMLTVISINLKTISNKDIKKGVVIQFDIVDEEKAYWFSNDASIGLDASSITFQNNYLKRVGLEIKKEILDNQIVFFINILCCFSVVVAILVIRKKHIFES